MKRNTRMLDATTHSNRLPAGHARIKCIQDLLHTNLETRGPPKDAGETVCLCNRCGLVDTASAPATFRALFYTVRLWVHMRGSRKSKQGRERRKHMCTSNRRITNTHAAHVTYFMRLVVAVFALQAAPSSLAK